jgi:hypothetical protein
VPVHDANPALRRTTLAAAAAAALVGSAAGALAPAVPPLHAGDARLAASAHALRAVHLAGARATSRALAAPATSASRRAAVTRQSPTSESESFEDS